MNHEGLNGSHEEHEGMTAVSGPSDLHNVRVSHDGLRSHEEHEQPKLAS